MKKNLIYLLFSVTLLCAALTACSDNDDLDSTSVVRPTTTEQNDLDRWLNTHHGHLQDATLLRLFHELQHDSAWLVEACEQPEKTTLQTIRILHHPHRVSFRE